MRRAVLVFVVLSSLLLACAAEEHGSYPVGESGGDTTFAAVRLAGAPAATAAAGTAHTTTVATVFGLPGGAQPVTFRGEGVIDFAAGMSRSVLDLSDATDSPPTDTTELETITAGGLLYVRAPMLTFLSGASEPWVRIDALATGQPELPGGALGLAPLAGLAGSDVGAPVALLAGVDASSVREVADAERRNPATTTFRAVVELPPTSFGDGTPDDLMAHELMALETFLDRIGARQLEVEVELDESDRIRRLVYDHAIPSPAGNAHQRFEVQYRDFGSAVEIEVPDDSDVRNLSDGSLQGPR